MIFAENASFTRKLRRHLLASMALTTPKPRNTIFNFARRARKLRYYGDVIHSCYRESAVEHDGGVLNA